MTERKTIIAKLIATHILLLPALLIITAILRNYRLILLSIDQTILLILFFAGYWEFFGTKFKLVFLSLCQIFILVLFAESLFSKELPSLNITALVIFGCIELYLLIHLVRIWIVIYRNDYQKIEINFPFSIGTYLITDGGNSKISRLMNYHFHSIAHQRNNTHLSMLYATDIVKLSNGKSKFLPTENRNYPVFGEPVYCPVDGIVFKVINDIDDNNPYSGNYPYNTGNTIVIKKNQYYLLLGHLKKGSVAVNVGDPVFENDFLGEVGNSGMSERPHLHLQLMKSEGADYWKGMGINIQYQGENLFKNRVINI